MKNTKATPADIFALIDQVLALRHGKAVKVNPDDHDNDKQLNEIGHAQAEGLKESLRGIGFNDAYSSPLPRAMDTTHISIGIKPKPLDVFGPSADANDPLNVMFEKLAYSPLQSYFNHELGEHLMNWGREALDRVVEEIKTADHGYAISVAIGGHAVCQNAFVWAILERLGVKNEQMSKLVLGYVLGEAEAISVVLNDGAVLIGLITPAITVNTPAAVAA